MRTNKEIIEIIRNNLAHSTMSMTELADKAGVSKSTLSRYLSYSRDFPLNKAGDFARALNISTEYLLGFSDTANNVHGNNDGMTGSNYGTFNNINGNNNIANVGDNKFEGNVTFGSAIDKNDLHEVASNLNLTDREIQEKTLNELAKTKQELRELKDSQRRLENAMALLIENQVSVLSKIKNVDNSFQDILGKLSDK